MIGDGLLTDTSTTTTVAAAYEESGDPNSRELGQQFMSSSGRGGEPTDAATSDSGSGTILMNTGDSILDFYTSYTRNNNSLSNHVHQNQSDSVTSVPLVLGAGHHHSNTWRTAGNWLPGLDSMYPFDSSQRLNFNQIHGNQVVTVGDAATSDDPLDDNDTDDLTRTILNSTATASWSFIIFLCVDILFILLFLALFAILIRKLSWLWQKICHQHRQGQFLSATATATVTASTPLTNTFARILPRHTIQTAMHQR